MPRQKTVNILQGIRDAGYTDTQILEHILFNYLSGTQAEFSILDTQQEFIPDTIDEDGFNHLT